MPEPPLGSATPRDRGEERPGFFKRIAKPIISVDPNASSAINKITGAIRGLKDQMKGLADQAERYKKAAPGGVSGTARVTGFQPHMAASGVPGVGPGQIGSQSGLWVPGGAAGRVPGFQPHMVPTGPGGPGGGRGGGGGGGGGSATPIYRGVLEAEMLQWLFKQGVGAMQDTMRSGAVTNRLALMNQPDTGAFRGIGPGGGGSAGPYGGMLRKAGGYWSREDLYEGGAILGRAGVLRGTDQRSYMQAQRAGQLGRLSGTDFAGGAGIIANLQNQANTLRMANIQVSPGGQARDPAQIFEELYQRTTGGREGKTAGKIFQTGQAEGTMTREGLKGLGLSDETIDAFMAFGAIRAQRGKALTPEQFGKAVDKNISNASESMRKFQESMSKLTDSLSTSLLPVFTGLANIISPVLNGLTAITDHLGTTGKAIVVLGIAAGIAAAKMAWSAGGGMGGLLSGGLGQAKMAGAMPGALPVMAGAAATIGGGALGSWAGGKIAGGDPGSGRNRLGKALGGAAGGAAFGAALGAWGGPIAPFTATGGAIIGGIVGGITGLFGDPVTKAWSGYNSINMRGIGDGYSDDDLLRNPPPAASTPGGGPLPGGGNSANLNPAFTETLKAMFAENPKLSLTSGWRSHEEQAYLRWKHLTGLKPEPVAPVGTSKHEGGNAADIGPASEYKWLAENGPRFGLKNTVGGEPWHWELHGAAASNYKPPPSAPTAVSAPKAAAKSTKASDARPKAAKKGKVRVASQNEADWVANILGTTSTPGSTKHEDIGDPVVSVYGQGRSAGGGATSITIQNLTLKVEIAKGTPDEAERAARYLMEILGDRSKLEALARK